MERTPQLDRRLPRFIFPDDREYPRVGVQRSTSLCAPGLVKFVPAVAILIFLALLWSFLTNYKECLFLHRRVN